MFGIAAAVDAVHAFSNAELTADKAAVALIFRRGDVDAKPRRAQFFQHFKRAVERAVILKADRFVIAAVDADGLVGLLSAGPRIKCSFSRGGMG